ncbi:MAG: CorA family divalent cation transporter [Geminicoccaceae bacterium]
MPAGGCRSAAARRLEATIEIGAAHDVSSALRESLHSLIRLVTFAREHAEDSLRRRLQAVDIDLHAVAEHNAYLAADMEFMLDATVGLIDIQQNKVIYILSIVSVVLTPPVLVASIYGMNFQHMPELAWSDGYPTRSA